MNMGKVFDKHGKHVDSFRKRQRIRSLKYYGWNSIIRLLNSRGYCVRRQLSQLGAP